MAMTIRPAAGNTGIVFRRVDLDGFPEIALHRNRWVKPRCALPCWTAG
ncbi:MAG: hypothetical protein R3E89_12325 [Thiolinea sp.]